MLLALHTKRLHKVTVPLNHLHEKAHAEIKIAVTLKTYFKQIISRDFLGYTGGTCMVLGWPKKEERKKKILSFDC